ncbi:MAG: ABC transporter ATP-binding protein [Clostridia bacterium]|nr:ABC transporter ATP-binding protein [Clostridia bacterium]
MADAHAILSFEHVGMTYFSMEDETNALQDITFDVRDGEILSVIGPSGCGKSTILSLAAGLLKPNEGKISLLGKPHDCPTAQIGYMLQSDHLLPWRTIYKNAILPLEIRNCATKDACARVRMLLEKYGLGDFQDKFPRELSGGMRQRAALIRTLSADPKLLLLDEPFSALDAQTRLAVSDDLVHIMREQNKAVILVTHDIAEAISIADRILLLSPRPGKIRKQYRIDIEGSPLQRRNDPRFGGYFDDIWKEVSRYVQ